MLAREARRRRAMGGGLYFYRTKDAVRGLLARGGYLADIGESSLYTVKTRPIAAIHRQLDLEICTWIRQTASRARRSAAPRDGSSGNAATWRAGPGAACPAGQRHGGRAAWRR
jgi:SulP family sulfate permease